MSATKVYALIAGFKQHMSKPYIYSLYLIINMQTMGLFDFLDGIPDDYEPKQRLTAEETEAIFLDLQKHPLFMTSIPENIEDYPELMALQHLQYDDTPENNAKALNEKGNEILRTKSSHKYFLKQAIKVYSDGIDQEPNDKALMAKMFSNRALVQMKLKNYKSALQDCRWSIEHDPSFVKPYYRAAQCLEQILHYTDAMRMIDAALTMDPKNKECLSLKQTIQASLNAMAKKQEKEKDLQRVRQICLSKKVQLRPAIIALPPEYQPQRISVNEDGLLDVPIIVTYPEFGQRDFIQRNVEDIRLKDALQQLFSEPLPWDQKGQYAFKDVVFYVNVEERKYAPVNPKATIIEILRNIELAMVMEILCVSKHPQNNFQVRTMYTIIE